MNEYLYSIYSAGLYYASVPSFVGVGDLENKQGFSSLYSVTLETSKAIQQTGTTQGYKGVVWSERLWLDIDTKHLSEEVSILTLQNVETKLKEMNLDFISYDSGGHPSVGGGHFGILRDTRPSHLLPAQDRSWVKEHFPQADSSIYTHLHLFRLPGTVHQVTGRQKCLVTRQSGKSLVLPKFQRAEVSSNLFDNEGQENSSNRSVFSNFEIMSQIGPQTNGQRHFSLVRLAFSLRDHNIPLDKAYWFLRENNKLFAEPKQDSEIEKIVRDVFGS